MNTSQPTIQNVSDTALWVAYYRAEESKKPQPLFHDPLAEVLIDDRAHKIAESMKDMGTHTRQNVLIRTVIIDRYIKKLVEQGVDCIINLGAGLDTRPYRLDLPPSLNWIEVDYSHLIDFKKKKLDAHKSQVHLERISLDLSVRAERKKLFTQINNKNKKILILTEGVLPYLTQEQVAELSEDLMEQKNFHYWIADYLSPAAYKYLRSHSQVKKLAKAPLQFFPKNAFDFFKTRGWNIETIQYIAEESYKLGRAMPAPWWFSLIKPFIGAKQREQFMRSSGYMVMSRG